MGTFSYDAVREILGSEGAPYEIGALSRHELRLIRDALTDHFRRWTPTSSADHGTRIYNSPGYSFQLDPVPFSSAALLFDVVVLRDPLEVWLEDEWLWVEEGTDSDLRSSLGAALGVHKEFQPAINAGAVEFVPRSPRVSSWDNDELLAVAISSDATEWDLAASPEVAR